MHLKSITANLILRDLRIF